MTEPLAEITKADVDRIDAVDEPATGIPFAIIKGLEPPTDAIEEIEKSGTPAGGEIVLEVTEAEPVAKAATAVEDPEAEVQQPETDKVEKAMTLDEAFEVAKAARSNGSPIDAGVLSLLRQVAQVIDSVQGAVEADVRQDVVAQQALAAAASAAEDAADGGADDGSEGDAAPQDAPTGDNPGDGVDTGGDGGEGEAAEDAADSVGADEEYDAEAEANTVSAAGDEGTEVSEPNGEAAQSPADTGDSGDLAPGTAPEDEDVAKAQDVIETIAKNVTANVMSQIRMLVEMRDPHGTAQKDLPGIEERVQKAVAEAEEPLRKRIRELEAMPVDSGVLLAGNTPEPGGPVNQGQGKGLATRDDFMKSAMAETDPAKRTELAVALLGAQMRGMV